MISIFDTEEIIIKDEQPLNYTAFIKIEEYLSACGILQKTTKSATTNDIIYYCDCPNAEKHGSDSVTATMVFADEGEKNPVFLCHHTQCKHLTFNDLLKAHPNIEATKFLDDAAYLEYQQTGYEPEAINNNDTDSPEQIALSKQIAFYGYDSENYLYFGSSDSFMLLRLKPHELSEKNLYAIYSDQNSWLLAFSDLTLKKPIMYWSTAANWLIKKSKMAGPFKARNMKFLGIHKEGQEFVLNTGTNIRRESGEFLSYHETRAQFPKSLYLPCQTDIIINQSSMNNDERNNLRELILRYPFTSRFNAVKFIGVLICGLVPGGLETRPNGWLTGESGSGKTQIFSYIISVLWSAAGGIVREWGTSAAGIEQDTKGHNIPIAYDEAEAKGGEAGNRKISAVINATLSSSTNGAGVTSKGTSSGHANHYKTQSCYLFGSVGDKVDDPTLKRRIAVFDLLNPKNEESYRPYKKQWRQLKHDTLSLINDDFAQRLFLYYVNNLRTLNKNIDFIQSWLIEFRNIGSELMGLYGPIFAAYLSLIFDGELKEEHLERIKKYVIELEQEQIQSDSEKSTGTILFNALLDTGIVRTADNKNIYIADLISIVLGAENFDNPIGFTISGATDLLSKCGIRVLPEERSVILSNTHQWLKSFFIKLDCPNHASRLKTYPGAMPTKTPINFYKSGSSRGIIIPLGKEFFKEKHIIKNNSFFDEEISCAL